MILNEMVARNITNQGSSRGEVRIELHFHGVNEISDATIQKIKSETVSAIRKILDDQ